VATISTIDHTFEDAFISCQLVIDPAFGGQEETFLNCYCHLNGCYMLRKKTALQEQPGDIYLLFELESVNQSVV